MVTRPTTFYVLVLAAFFCPLTPLWAEDAADSSSVELVDAATDDSSPDASATDSQQSTDDQATTDTSTAAPTPVAAPPAPTPAPPPAQVATTLPAAHVAPPPPPVAPAPPAPPAEQFKWPDTAEVSPDTKPLLEQEALLEPFKQSEEALKKIDDALTQTKTVRDAIAQNVQMYEQKIAPVLNAASRAQGTLAQMQIPDATNPVAANAALGSISGTLENDTKTLNKQKKALASLLTEFDQQTLDARTKLTETKGTSAQILHKNTVAEAKTIQTEVQKACDQINETIQKFVAQSSEKNGTTAQSMQKTIDALQATVQQATKAIAQASTQQTQAPTPTPATSNAATPAPSTGPIPMTASTAAPTMPEPAKTTVSPTPIPTPPTPIPLPQPASTEKSITPATQAKSLPMATAPKTTTAQPASTPPIAPIHEISKTPAPAPTESSAPKHGMINKWIATGMALISSLWQTLNPTTAQPGAGK